MNIDLYGKTAIVTGATGGIGLAIAIELAKAGAQVTVVERDQRQHTRLQWQPLLCHLG